MSYSARVLLHPFRGELSRGLKMRVNKILLAASAVCAAVLVSAVTEVRAQAPPPPKHETADKAKADADRTARCQAMMAEREKKVAEMKASDARLDELVATMNAAPAADKATATAAVVTEMVAQRRAMRAAMDHMQHGAMSHMMEHMHGDKARFEQCPMMKAMGAMKH